MAETKPTQFDYLLNAFEQASQHGKPASVGYAAKRKALLAYVRELEADRARLDWLASSIDDATTAEFDTTLWRDWEHTDEAESPLYAVTSSFAGEGRGKTLRAAIDDAKQRWEQASSSGAARNA